MCHDTKRIRTLPAPTGRATRVGHRELLKAAHAQQVHALELVIQALGYEPDRSSLYRLLQELASKGVIDKVSIGEGRVPTTYRRAGAGHSPANP